MHRPALSQEAGTCRVRGNIVVLLMIERLDFVGACLDRGAFKVGVERLMVRFDDPDLIKKKLVTPRSAELAFLEQDAKFGRGSIYVVGIDFDDDRYFVRRVTFEDDVFHDEFVGPGARPFFDRAFDDITRNTFPSRLLESCREPGIAAGVRASEFGGDHDFANELGGLLAFL